MINVSSDTQYLGVHIFYNTYDLRPVILRCVDPVVRRLESDGLIQRFFITRYWEGGPHVRLRLQPAEGVTSQDIKETIEPLIHNFLQLRPSLFDADAARVTPVMRKLFEIEYGPDAFVNEYGANGEIPLATNNSYEYVPYEPEWERYGGPAGVALAEEHFHISSRIALKAISESNSHVHSSLLGLSMQLMLHLAWTFTDDNKEVENFFRFYSERWQTMDYTPGNTAGIERKFERQKAVLLNHVLEARCIHREQDRVQSPVLSHWLKHARWLRENIRAVYAAGKLELDPPAQSEAEAVTRLLTSYIHMMNNRLGVLIREEVYLSHILVRTLEEINAPRLVH